MFLIVVPFENLNAKNLQENGGIVPSGDHRDYADGFFEVTSLGCLSAEHHADCERELPPTGERRTNKKNQTADARMTKIIENRAKIFFTNKNFFGRLRSTSAIIGDAISRARVRSPANPHALAHQKKKTMPKCARASA